ncbi:MAG: glycosyltransferase [Pseudomonadota bacterium]
MGKQKAKGKSRGDAKPPRQPAHQPAPVPADPAAPPEARIVTPAPGARRPTISLCMMVKNEEKRLPTAMGSAAPWVDEIIVVDTGSSDRTMAIARGFGAKIYEHPWQNSFSIHRNQTLSYATGDWVLILDADEEIDQSTAAWLHRIVFDPEVNAFFFELNNVLKEGGESFILHPRLFRNGRGFHYEGLVHNKPVFDGPAAKAPVRIIHYGYAEDPATMEAKRVRRLGMIRQWVANEPENYVARAYLSHTLLERADDLEEAVSEGLKALELAKAQQAPAVNMPRIYYPLLTGLGGLRRKEETLKYALECLEYVPNYADAMFYVSWARYESRQWDEVCQSASEFLRLQEHSRQHPDEYIYFENLTFERINAALLRWVAAAAHLGREDEALMVVERMLEHADARNALYHTVSAVLGFGFTDLTRRLAERLMVLRPDWDWPPQTAGLARQKLAQTSLPGLREAAAQALAAGDLAQAAEQLTQAADLDGLNPEVRVNLGRALMGLGRSEEAAVQLMAALDLNPGFAWAWEALGRMHLEQGDWRGARELFSRLLTQKPGDAQAQAGLRECAARLAGQPEPPSVAQAPPRLLVLLVSGLSPEMIRQPAPHFLMHRAWGQADFDPDVAGASGPAWASLYSGRPAAEHGLTAEPSRQRPLGLDAMRLMTIWDAIASRHRLGLAAIPLGHPAPALPGGGWAAAGWPAGLMRPELASPPQLAARLIAAGYRSDMALNAMDDLTLPQRLKQDVRQEGLLNQVERNKLKAVLQMPAVEVLAVGLNLLEHSQRAFGLADYHTFNAYQQLYGWIEMLLAALRPAHFALLSQRSYGVQEGQPRGGGFYCLSWLRGENGHAPAIEIAPQILKLLEIDPAAWLGRPRA